MLVESLPSRVKEKNKAIGEIDAVISILNERKKARALRKLSVVNFVTIPEIERWLKLGVVGRFDLPSDEIAIRRVAARAEVEHLMNLVVGEPMGIQIALLEETLPNITFQLFRGKRQTSLGLSPFRLGGELPNIRLGLAMVTSDAQAVELYEKLADDLWRCAHKGSDAVKLLKAALDRSGIRRDKRALKNRGRSNSRASGCEALAARGSRRSAAVAGGPRHWVVQEMLNRLAVFGRQMFTRGPLQDVGPGCERMQFETRFLQTFDSARKSVMVENRQRVLDDGAGRTQSTSESELACAISGQIVHQENAQAFNGTALDLRIASDAERAFADVAQFQSRLFGEQSGERDAGRFGAGNRVERVASERPPPDMPAKAP